MSYVYYAVDKSNELSHFGIKGQKWGIRRFQNEDGTLTEEGRRRYLEIQRDYSEGRRAAKENGYSEEDAHTIGRQNAKLRALAKYGETTSRAESGITNGLLGTAVGASMILSGVGVVPSILSAIGGSTVNYALSRASQRGKISEKEVEKLVDDAINNFLF